MNKYEEALNTMCRRCSNHEMCMGTGCQPRALLKELTEKAEEIVMDKQKKCCANCLYLDISKKIYGEDGWYTYECEHKMPIMYMQHDEVIWDYKCGIYEKMPPMESNQIKMF